MTKRRLIAILLAICLLSVPFSALADAYVLHKPGKGQLTEVQAWQRANDHFAALFGIRSGSLSYLVCSFGPGDQWDAGTTDDVWALEMKDNEGPLSGIYVFIHGTTGEVLRWICRKDNTTYIDLLPDETHIAREEAAQLAASVLANCIEADPQTILDQGQFESCFQKDPEYGPVWRMSVRYDTRYAVVTVDAVDGAILGQSEN